MKQLMRAVGFGCFVVGECLDATWGQVGLSIVQDHLQRFSVVRFGVGDLVRQRDFMFHVDQKVVLEAKPLDDFVDVATVVRVFLAAVGGLRQALFFFNFGSR